MMTCSRVLCSAPLEVGLFLAAVKAFDDNIGNCINWRKIDSVFIYFLVGGVVEEIPWVSVLTLRLHRR